MCVHLQLCLSQSHEVVSGFNFICFEGSLKLVVRNLDQISSLSFLSPSAFLFLELAFFFILLSFPPCIHTRPFASFPLHSNFVLRTVKRNPGTIGISQPRFSNLGRVLISLLQIKRKNQLFSIRGIGGIESKDTKFEQYHHLCDCDRGV